MPRMMTLSNRFRWSTGFLWILGACLFVCSGFAAEAASAQSIVLNPMATSGGVSASVGRVDGAAETTSGEDFDGNTKVAVPDELRDLLRLGGVPESLDQLRLLEKQQQAVAHLGEACTVGVKIGAAQGCGVIITRTGLVLTAAHVAMRPGKTAEILLPDGRTVLATTLGMNRGVDAGVLRIRPDQNNGKPWPCASPGTSQHLEPGMWCIATGHPGGYDQPRGAVTRIGRILVVQPGSIVTDCALIGGDSGGPLFDLEGRLIAIHSRIGNDVADNLHVPVDHYKDGWDRLMSGESWGVLPGFKPIIGVSGNSSLGVAKVISVRAGSPADEAGIRADDVIKQFGDVRITDFSSLTSAVSDTMPGERVVVWLERGGTEFRALLVIGRAGDD